MQWPNGTQDLKEHLFLKVNDFTDKEANDLVEPILDLKDPENPVITKKRKRFVNYAGNVLIAPSLTDIQNKEVSVDLRSIQLVKDSIVEVKP